MPARGGTPRFCYYYYYKRRKSSSSFTNPPAHALPSIATSSSCTFNKRELLTAAGLMSASRSARAAWDPAHSPPPRSSAARRGHALHGCGHPYASHPRSPDSPSLFLKTRVCLTPPSRLSSRTWPLQSLWQWRWAQAMTTPHSVPLFWERPLGCHS